MNLPLTSTHWGTYRIVKKNGRIEELRPFEEDGDPSPIGRGILDVIEGPTRIGSPMIRKSWLEQGPGKNSNGRGKEAFVAVSWDKALSLVSRELTRVIRNFGNNAIYGGSYGWASAGRFHHAQSQLRRFLNCIGGFTYSKNSYSTAAGEVAVGHVLGDFMEYLATTTSWDSIASHTDLVVAFGGIASKNGQVNSGGVGRHYQNEGIVTARNAGVSFVSISPLQSDISSEINAEWLAPRPNTDTAIMLALAHTLLVEDLYDNSFIHRYTTGFEKVRSYLLGETDGIIKDAEWAANISEIRADAIRELARRMARGRTMLSVSWSLTRQDHGEQPLWAAVTVAAMLGQIGLPGGGIGFGYSSLNGIGNHYTRIPGASFPQGSNPVKDFIPVARISDMLLQPGNTIEYNGSQLTFPEIRLVYWAGGNPFHHHQNLNRLVKAWQKPDTIIVHEWCWNANARYADIVLPCTTHLERNDLGLSSRDPYIIYMSKAVDPVGNSRNDFNIFGDLAERMNVAEQFTEGRDEAAWIKWIYELTKQNAAREQLELPTFEELKQCGWFKVKSPESHVIMLQSFRENPDKHPLNTPSGKIEIYSERVAGFGYDDCPGHAVWLEPIEWLGQENSMFPIHLISNQPRHKLHSQLDHGSVSRENKIADREPVLIHPGDAQARKVRTGDLVRIFNERGACLASAVLDEQIRPGVIQMSTGAWYDPLVSDKGFCKHGNPNVLTRDKGTSSLAQGPIAHSCLVDFEIFKGDPLPVTAFVPPDIVSDIGS